MSSFTIWVVLIATSTLCFAIKLVGYFVPARWLANERLQRINSLIPVVLLSALVVAQALAVKTHIVLDHRVAGVAAAMNGACEVAATPDIFSSSATSCGWRPNS